MLDTVDIFGNGRDTNKKEEIMHRGGIPKEGIYIFGGKDQNGIPKNNVYYINTEKKKYAMEKLEV